MVVIGFKHHQWKGRGGGAQYFRKYCIHKMILRDLLRDIDQKNNSPNNSNIQRYLEKYGKWR